MIHQLKQGNEPFLVELYKQYRDEFIRWAVKDYRCNSDDAKDIFQETR